MKHKNILPRLSAFLITSLFTLSFAVIQEYGNLYWLLQDETIQQFTTQILQFATSDF